MCVECDRGEMKTPVTLRLLALVACIPTVLSAQTLSELLPAQATHCAIVDPPEQAGIAATPGGFVMVFPRNAALTDTFTGCKLLWIVDGATMRRFVTLYFRNGALAIAAAHDIRGDPAKLTGACAFPGGKSLLPKDGQPPRDAACAGFAGEAFYALRLPTWPRRCVTDPDAAICKADPRDE